MLSSKQSAWDKIRAAVAEYADRAGDAASDFTDSAADVAAAGWGATRSGVRTAASATAGAGKAAGSAVASGVAAVDHKVESVADGVIAGAIAGALASWVMNQFQAADAAAKSPATEQATGAQAEAAHSGGTAKGAAQAADGQGENATVQVADKLAPALLGRPLTEEEKPKAGNAVHYGYGAAMGAIYGGLTEIAPVVGMGLGIPYATAMWLFGDEIAVSALGLGKLPAATTPDEHATSFAAHLVYGVTLDIARRVLRHIV